MNVPYDLDCYSLSSLPDDILFHIASFLDGNELVALSTLTPTVGKIANHPQLWRALLRRTYGLSTSGQTDSKAAEAARWKRQYFTRKREWDRTRHASLSERVNVCAQWGATCLFRHLMHHMAGDVNQLYGDKNALHVASRCGSIDLVKMLVEELHADPNTTSLTPVDSDMTSRLSTEVNRHTPLSFAVQGGSEETVQWLLQHGARTELNDCLRCLVAASAEGLPNLVQVFLEKLRPFKPSEGWIAGLFGQGDSVDSKAMEDAFLVAVDKASARNLTALQLLLSDMPARLTKKATAALDKAVSAGNVPAVDELLRHGVPATKAAGEWAPIHAAAVGGNLEMIQLLIQHGADAGTLAWYQGEQQNAHVLALRTHGKPDVLEFLRKAPSPVQKEAQLVFRIAVAVLGLALALAVWLSV